MLPAENPALVVLGLHHEEAEPRHDHMVDLRGAALPVGDGDVVDHPVDILGEEKSETDLHQRLP
jgi:hypothetical protein